ncbi:MAG: phosphonate ABC transporter ATP-binding protein [Burkholderiales bacterium]
MNAAAAIPLRPVDERSDPAIELTDIGLVHPNGQRALGRVTLRLACGERVAIIGPSGAGKTSLLRLIGTSLRPTGGRVAVLGENPWQLDARSLRRLRARLGLIHQSPPIPPRQRAITAVLAGKLGQWSWWRSALSLLYPSDIVGAREILSRLDLADRLFERCDRLSGGQLQRVGVARVLYQAPTIVLADEPVSAMDPALADLTIQQLNNDAQSRATTLLASLHAVDLALRWFPRIVGVKAGEIVFDLRAQQVTEEMLRDLYASETATPPVQGNQRLVLPQQGLAVAGRPLCS